ncbi:hypothetical protein [Micromonospora sp. WMMD712]|uniref:hypothetical protein n=1 Tax=Micromonospora sp. WMMD712 TaxID=3016096 RepID=UPI00249CD9E2|nr:hypothetical protein [Micromonospora sp. WMMD712]WFE56815.1 hypothetical protein O7633_07970 [Micromonospora sp. WMMD712]
MEAAFPERAGRGGDVGRRDPRRVAAAHGDRGRSLATRAADDALGTRAAGA